MRNVTIERVVMTRKQSMQKFGNPYGDDANMLLLALNAAWKARRELATAFPEMMFPHIDSQLREMVEYLKLHEQARPWQFNQFEGYSYVDQSSNNWEGRYRNF